jgi:hypothetical protein
VVAHAKLVAAWPDGKELLCGTPTSGLGSEYTDGGRGRLIAARSAQASRSATTSAKTTCAKTNGRRQSSARASASSSQISPCPPIRDSASKIGFSQPAR